VTRIVIIFIATKGLNNQHVIFLAVEMVNCDSLVIINYVWGSADYECLSSYPSSSRCRPL